MPRFSLASRAATTAALTHIPSVGTTPSPRTARLMRQRLTLALHLADLKKQAAVLDAKLLPLLKAEAIPDDKGAQRLAIEGAGKLVLVKGTSRTLDPKLLIVHGVRASVIKECTRESPYEYPRAYPEGEGEE